MRGYPEHLHEVINEDLQESIYDETLEGEIIRDSQYSLEIMKQELKNKYISPEILYAFKASIQALEKQIPKGVQKKVVGWKIDCFCPSCTLEVSSKQSYCSVCGQYLNWD